MAVPTSPGWCRKAGSARLDIREKPPLGSQIHMQGVAQGFMPHTSHLCSPALGKVKSLLEIAYLTSCLSAHGARYPTHSPALGGPRNKSCFTSKPPDSCWRGQKPQTQT